MLRTVLLACFCLVARSQFPYNHGPNALPYSHGAYNPHYGHHQPQSSPAQQHFGLSSYPNAPASSRFGSVPSTSGGSFQSAPVHYVSIGPQLQGDYKFGYSTGGGSGGNSFREETRLPDGTVKGAYGYIDASGKMRIIKYTAGKDGFKAEGDLVPENPKANSVAPHPQPASPTPQHYAPAAPNPHQQYSAFNHFNQAPGAQSFHPSGQSPHQPAGPVLSYNINLSHHQ